MKPKKNKLGFKLTLVALIAVICSVMVFFVIQTIGLSCVRHMDKDGSMKEKITAEAINDLQYYADENKISSADIKTLFNKHYDVLAAYQSNALIYDTTDMFPNTIEDNQEFWCGPPYTLQLQDGNIQVYIYVEVSNRYYNLINFIALFFAAISFIVLFYGVIHKKIAYILRLEQEMRILEGGDLTYPITVKGKDELGDLAESINGMRLSFMERQKNENDAVQNSRDLVSAMSHDLRTPLTSLLGYLELLYSKKYTNRDQLEEYISISRDKALRIKEMTDQLFHYSLNNDKKVYNKQEIDAYEFLQQLSSDLIYELESAGFSVEYSAEAFGGKLNADGGEIARVFENILSNLKKYALSTAPIIMTVTPSNYAVTISIENLFVTESAEPIGTGLGMKTCQRILAEHDGNIVAYAKGQIYRTSLTLPMEVE